MADLAVEPTPDPRPARPPAAACTRTPAAGSRRTGSARRWSPSACPTSARCRTTSPSTHAAGATRGIHAEPWDKFVSVATGRVFGAWVDLREGDVLRRHVHTSRSTRASRCSCRAASATPTRRSRTARRTPTSSTTTGARRDVPRARPRRPDRRDPVADPARRGRDLRQGPAQPAARRDVTPMPPKRTLIIGAHGQLGRALRGRVPRRATRSTATSSTSRDADAVGGLAVARVRRGPQRRRLHRGRRRRDARGPARPPGPSTPPRPAALARSPASTGSRSCTTPPTTSSTAPPSRTPRTSRSPRWASTARPRPPATSRPRRRRGTTCCARRGSSATAATSSARCRSLAERGVCPEVVDDQVGRLTFTTELARATRHLLDTGAAYGTYNVTNGGPATSWADARGRSSGSVAATRTTSTPISTEEYAAGKAMLAAAPEQHAGLASSRPPASPPVTPARGARRTTCA